MAEQELVKMKLSLEHNITKKDGEIIVDITKVLEDLNKVKFDGTLAKQLVELSAALKTFKGINISKNLGKGITGIVEAANAITEVKDITPYARNLNSAFEILQKATKPFKGASPNINKGLGVGISGIVEAINRIDEVKDISLKGDNIRTGFNIMAFAAKNFDKTNIKINANLGKGIVGIVDAINSIDEVKDISLKADNLVTGFNVLAYISKNFEGVRANIPVNLGKGITGLVEAINKIDEVKNLSDVSETLKTNFRDISIAIEHFDGLNKIDYSGIAKLVTAITNVSSAKKINNNVIENAEKLAKAINTLDKEVTADTPKLDAMSKVASKLGVTFNTSSGGVNKFGSSLKLLNFELVIRNIRRVTNAIQGLVKKGYEMVDAFGDVENTLSFFSQSLGTESESTAKIIQQYADLGAVDFTKFSDQVAKLNQIYKGYGIAASDAATMALNMTQLAYDASFALGENGKDIDMWMQRTTAVATGQTRSGYYFGVDTSVKALSESFDEMSSNAAKATRSTAAYNAMIMNTKELQGQLPREFQNTYVQMDVLRNRVNLLKQSIGQALVPMFQWIIKWGQVAIAVVERLINAISLFFGGSGFQLINYADMIKDIGTSTGGIASGAEDIADGMAGANKQAKELKKTITGIDQVFTINDIKDTGGAGGAGIAGGVGALAPIEGYDWLASLSNVSILDEVNEKADRAYQKIKDMAPWVMAVGASFAGWKIAKSFMDSLKWISGLKGIFGGLGLSALPALTGILAFGNDLVRLKNYIKEFMEEGPNFDNVTGILTSFIGTIGDLMIMTGNIQIGGFIKLVQSVLDIVWGLYDMTQVGVNWENAEKVIYGLGGLAIAIGVLHENWAAVGTGLIIQGLLGAIKEIKEVYDSVKAGEGSWSDLLSVEMFISAVSVVGGIIVAFKKLNDVKKKSGAEMLEAPKAIGEVSTATGGVSTKLTSLVKNLALGIVIMAEVAVAAGIFVGSIWIIGELLQKVIKAWEPVIADGKTAALGIALGTTLLVGVGVATWALGTVAIGGAGSLPLAIAAGTAMLVLLTAATVLFIQELKIVANQLSKELSPAMAGLNEVMPALTENTRAFTMFMIEFAGHMVAYAASSAVAGIAGTINTIVGWFTKDPIKTMANDAKKNGEQFANLNAQLEITNPLVQKAVGLMSRYSDLLTQLKTNADKAASIGTPAKIGKDFKDFSKSLRDGFDDLDKTKTANVAKIMQALSSIDLSKFKGIGTQIVQSMELGITSYQFNLEVAVNKVKTGLTFNITPQGTKVAQDFTNAINTFSVNLNSFTTKIKTALTFSATSYGSNVARDVVTAINGASVNLNNFTNKIKTGITFNATSYGSNIAKNVISGINNAGTSVSTFTNRIKNNLNFGSYYIGSNIAAGVQNGINGWYPNVNTFVNRLKNNMTVSFTIKSPSRWARDFVGKMLGAGVEVGINDYDPDLNPFRRNINNELTEMIDDVSVSPIVEMPTFDTKALSGDISKVSSNLNAQVKGQFNYTNDGTEKAIYGMTNTMVDKLETLIQAVEDGKVIMIDEEKIGETSDRYIKNKAVRMNTVFGGR